LLGLVEDLSFATMFDAGNITKIQNRIKVNLVEVISLTVQKLNETENLQNKQYLYELQIDPNIKDAIVIVDERLLRVLHHLLSNAFRYGDEDHQLLIQIKEHKEKSKEILNNSTTQRIFSFKIINKIKNEEILNEIYINRCFQNYFLSDLLITNLSSMDSAESDLSLSLSSSEGLGLGLYVAYNNLQILESLLECSIVNDECCFSFLLTLEIIHVDAESTTSMEYSNSMKLKLYNEFVPIYDTPIALKHIEITEKQRKINEIEAKRLFFEKRKRILVVDDSPICRKVLGKILKENGYDFNEACNGKVFFFFLYLFELIFMYYLFIILWLYC
jgi:CheY-like chemotaxis protein